MMNIHVATKGFFPSCVAAFALTVASCTLVCGQTSLKDAFKSQFLVGAALDSSQICESKPEVTQLITSQYNTIVAENVMKWERIHPLNTVFNFNVPDKFVDFGQKHNMFIVGHTLLWHSQVAPYVFLDNNGKTISRDSLLERLRIHITTIMTRYKGRIHGYDVVNEALNEDGTMRQSPWFKILGEDYIEKAFEFAHAADPNAQLYYNDYNIEMPAKRAGAIRIIKKLQAKGIRIDGVGIQGHWHLNSPSISCIDSALTEFAKLGVKIMLTEFDINVLPVPDEHTGANVSDFFELTPQMNPYVSSLPDSVQLKLAQRYASLFNVFLKHKGDITRVTFWGVHDKQSWLNGWPIPGRTNYPLLYDRNLQPKSAYFFVLNTILK